MIPNSWFQTTFDISHGDDAEKVADFYIRTNFLRITRLKLVKNKEKLRTIMVSTPPPNGGGGGWGGGGFSSGKHFKEGT